jgi:hypothetical protein
MCAIRGCEGHILSKVFSTPFYFYVILAFLVELAQLHHQKASNEMFETWKEIEKMRERADLAALYSLFLKRKHLSDEKLVGKQWVTFVN